MAPTEIHRGHCLFLDCWQQSWEKGNPGTELTFFEILAALNKCRFLDIRQEMSYILDILKGDVTEVHKHKGDLSLNTGGNKG
ncbi:hypothetical protein D3C77_715670 [compost metagenome]